MKNNTAASLGFLLSDVFSRYFALSAVDPKHLLDSSLDISDVVLRTSKLFPTCEGARSLPELKTAICLFLRAEISELGDNMFVRYFMDSHRINCFFAAVQHMLDSQEKECSSFWEVEKNSIGYYDQLRCIELCRSFREMKTFGLRDSGIERFFEGVETVELDCQKAYLQVLRRYYEEYYKESRDHPSFREIILEEIKMFVADIYLSRGEREAQEEELREYVPRLDGPGEFHIDRLVREIGQTRDVDGVKELFGIRHGEIADGLRRKRMLLYKSSFDTFDDLSVIYSFLQLRDLQTREILFVAEELLNGESGEAI